MRSKRLRILICSLLLMVTLSFVLDGSGAYAYQGGLLQGQVAGGNGTNKDRITDNNLGLGGNIAMNGVLTYTLDDSYDITSVFLSAPGGAPNYTVYRFYNSIGGLISSVSFTASGYKTVDIKDAKYVYVVNTCPCDQNIIEVDVYGTAKDTELPTVPTNLTGTPTDVDKIDFSWNASTDNKAVAGYNLFRNGVKVNTSLITATSYALSGLASNEEASYSVTSVDINSNESEKSISVNVTTFPVAVLPLLTYTSSSKTVTLKWDAVGTSYEVWNTFEGVDYLLFTTSANSYTVTGLEPLSDSVYYIKAIDVYGRKNKSNVVTATTKDPPPVEVPVLTLTKKTFNSVELSWNAVGNTYEVYKGDELLYTSNKTSYIVADLTHSTVYDFKVIAIDDYDRRTNSNVLSVKTSDLPPTASLKLASTALTFNSVKLFWNDIGDVYDILRDGVKVGSSTSAFYSPTGLTPSTTYVFQVSYVDVYGRTVLSGNYSVTTLVQPVVSTPAPVVPPPKVMQSKNEDLNVAGDQLAQGVGDMKQKSVLLIVLIILAIIFVFGLFWLVKITKRFMMKAVPGTTSSPGGAAAVSASGGSQKEKGNATARTVSSPSKKSMQIHSTKNSKTFQMRKRYNSYEKSNRSFKKSR